jgi:hypothetical protein
MNAMPWPETHLPLRKGAQDQTLHVTESVSWMTKQKIAHRFPPPHGWVVGRFNSRTRILYKRVGGQIPRRWSLLPAQARDGCGHGAGHPGQGGGTNKDLLQVFDARNALRFFTGGGMDVCSKL